MDNQYKNNQIIIYNTKDGEAKIEAQMKDETVWLSQNKNSVTEEYSVTEKNKFKSYEIQKIKTNCDF